MQSQTSLMSDCGHVNGTAQSRPCFCFFFFADEAAPGFSKAALEVVLPTQGESCGVLSAGADGD